MIIFYFQDAAGEWRWQLVAPNHRIIADGGEGYTRKSNVIRAAKNMVKGIRGCEPIIIEKK